MRTPDGERAAGEVFAARMPEMVPVLDRPSARAPEPGAIASAHPGRPETAVAACTRAAVDGVLPRNYDPVRCDRTIVRSGFLRPVIGTGEVQGARSTA